jgi:integrase
MKLPSAWPSTEASKSERPADTGNLQPCGRAPSSPRHWFEPAVRKVRLRAFSWHCIRHTFASRLMMAGADIRTVRELLGHRSILMTVRYGHLSPQHTQPTYYL